MAGGSLDETTVLLVALVLVLVFVLIWWMTTGQKHHKNGTPAHNHGHSGAKNFTGNHSQWHLGGQDAGNGGSMHRDPTIYHQASLARANPNYPTKPVCGPGQAVVQQKTPSGDTVSLCVPAGSAGAMQCGGNWDPESVAQLQSLATMGSLDVSSDPSLAQAASGRRGQGSALPGLSPHSSLSA